MHADAVGGYGAGTSSGSAARIHEQQSVIALIGDQHIARQRVRIRPRREVPRRGPEAAGTRSWRGEAAAPAGGLRDDGRGPGCQACARQRCAARPMPVTCIRPGPANTAAIAAAVTASPGPRTAVANSAGQDACGSCCVKPASVCIRGYVPMARLRTMTRSRGIVRLLRTLGERISGSSRPSLAELASSAPGWS